MCPGWDLAILLYKRTSPWEALEVRASSDSSGIALRVIRRGTTPSDLVILFETLPQQWDGWLNISANTSQIEPPEQPVPKS